MNKIFLICIILFTGLQLKAQEVRCNLTVNTQQVTGGSIQLDVIESFERQVREFINERRWTNDVIKENEKIEFSMLINITEASGSGSFKAQTQIQTVRPVYNSGYNTAVFSYKDDNFEFVFSQMDVLNSPKNSSQLNWVEKWVVERNNTTADSSELPAKWQPPPLLFPLHLLYFPLLR